MAPQIVTVAEVRDRGRLRGRGETPCLYGTLSTLCALLLLLAACTDAGLQPVVEDPGINAQDDRVTVVGEVCSSPSEEVVFPVKILFVIDTSGTMQQTDPNNRRATAVEEVVARYRNNPGVSIGIVSFRESINDLTDGFTRDQARLAQAVEGLRLADSLTDYQGALGMAYRVVQQDLLNTSAAERARSKYVVVFLSDGTPQPLCHRSRPCGSDADCDHRTSCVSGQCTDPFLVCETDRDGWDDIQVPDHLYPDMAAGTDYNQPYQVLAWVDELLALEERWSVGEIRLHTGFLFDPDTSEAWLEAFALDPEAGEQLLTDMSLHGGGRFMNFSSGDEIDFLQVDYTAIRRDFVLRSLFASNVSVSPAGTAGDELSGRTTVDSDGDGLSDGAEFEGGTDPLSPDSDGDGWGDALEETSRARGFDPLDPAKPAEICDAVGRIDRDGDGLRDCEEAFLGTDPVLFDSDRDGLPDGVEVGAGTDPLADDGGDLDGDGVRDEDEVRRHTDPRVRDTEQARAERYQIDIDPLPIEGQGQHCYEFAFENIRLDQTLAGQTLRGQESPLDETPGLNVIYVWFDQALEDDPHDPGELFVACALARWVRPYYRDPAGGVLSLTRDDFKPATALAVPDDCVGVAPTPPAEDGGGS